MNFYDRCDLTKKFMSNTTYYSKFKLIFIIFEGGGQICTCCFFRPKIFNVMLKIMEFLKIWTRIVSDMSTTTTFWLTSLTPELLLVKNNQVNLFLSWCWWVNESTVKVKVMVLQILHFLSLARCEIEVIKSHQILHFIP